MLKITLNADVGEGLESDQILCPFLQQASIACGGHAGDKHTMRQAVRSCLEYGVSIGAHPSYPDKENFGRLSQVVSAADLIELIQKQIGALHQACNELDATLDYVKPHGALYNDMMRDADIFVTVVTAVAEYPLSLKLMVGAMPVTAAYQALAAGKGISIIPEAFADRRYRADGQLQSRAESGAVLDKAQDIVTQFKRIVEQGEVITAESQVLEIKAKSVCLHGDNPASVEAAPLIADYLDKIV